MTAVRLGLTVPVAIALVGGGCGTQEDARGDLAAYIERANVIQSRAAPALGKANAIYAQQATGRLPSAEQLSDLGRAEAAIRQELAQLEALPAPAGGERLRTLLLRVVGQNLTLTTQTVRLAAYARQAPEILRPLGPAGRRLGRRLTSRAAASEQAVALDSYAQRLTGMLRSLERLKVPVVLRPTHEAQVRRLERVRALARRLRSAAAAGDAPRLARLLLGFGRLGDVSGPRQRTLARQGIAAYTDHLKRLERARDRLAREQIRLNREVL